MPSHKKLALNRDLISDYISENISADLSIVEKPNNLKILTVRKAGHEPAILNIYYVKDGTTTINPDVGKNQKWSNEITQHIIQNCSVRVFGSTSFSVKSVNTEDYDSTKIFLVDEFDVTIDETTEESGKKVCRITGKQGDKISMSYHTNKTLQIQGKPLIVFNQVVEVFSVLFDLDNLIESQLKSFDIDFTKEELYEEFESLCPALDAYAEDKIKAILTPSIALRKLNIEFDDYSAIVFPVLRGLEGVIKQLFKENGVIITKEGFGDHFTNNGSAIELTVETKEIIANPEVQHGLCRLYKEFNKHRHSLFHIDGAITTTRILEDKKSAISLFNTVIEKIEETLTKINESI